MRQILVNVEPYEKRVAIVKNGILDEFHIERADSVSLAGNIYKGVVESVVPGIGALFVNIGTGKNGFLYIEDAEHKISLSVAKDEDIVIEKKSSRRQDKPPGVKKGDELLVQVVKEPIGTKGPLLTTDISIPGKNIVFMPFNDTIGISKRIEDRERRSEIKKTIESLRMPPGSGCIARTQSANSSARQLRNELRYLLNLWAKIKYRADREKSPAVIYEEYSVILRIIRDYLDEDIEKIMVDSREDFKRIYRFAKQVYPPLIKKIFFYRAKTPLFRKMNVDEQLEKLFRRKVFLRSGGHIVIEQTEGFFAVDVNTGKFTGKKRPEDTIFKTNLEAAEEIARQIRLRDIGGIIVIDFIDMHDRNHRRDVHRALVNAFESDKARLNVLPISSIGLIEMTRQRIRKSPESVSFTDCPYCSGKGKIKTPATIAIGALRKLQSTITDNRIREISVICSHDVAGYLENSCGDVLRNLERRYRTRIKIKPDTKIHAEDVYFE